jgi:hypothetical protein
VAQGGTLSYRFFQDRPAASHIVAELTQASLAVLIFGLLFSVSITLAQKTGRPDRKVIARVQPAYPQILKKRPHRRSRSPERNRTC